METTNKKFLKNLAILTVFLIFVLAFNRAHVSRGPKDIKGLVIAGQSIKVDLALTDPVREQGLSGRNPLEENEGMLFVFEHPDKYNFWMKDMNFPIDMIWLNTDMKVVYIKKDARPELYPEEYGPEENATYVLEIASGFSEKNNLKIGDRATFTY